MMKNKRLRKVPDYQKVYEICEGDVVEDFTAGKDGYIWYDECGLLGAEKVYNTAQEAHRALSEYIERYL